MLIRCTPEDEHQIARQLWGTFLTEGAPYFAVILVIQIGAVASFSQAIPFSHRKGEMASKTV